MFFDNAKGCNGCMRDLANEFQGKWQAEFVFHIFGKEAMQVHHHLVC